MAGESATRLLVTAVILGTLSLSFSFIAFSTRLKTKDVNISPDGVCTYGSSAAFALGIVAAIFLLTEQVVISSGTGCFCCGGSRCHATCGSITALILFVCSWLTFVIAFMGLLAAAIFNSGPILKSTFPGKRNNGDEAIECFNVTKNSIMFLGDVFWSIVSIVLGLISYITFKRSERNQNIQTSSNITNEQGITMGQPSMEAK